MLKRINVLLFSVRGGKVTVDFKLLSRNLRKSLRVEEAVLDPKLPITVLPLSFLERLRSPSIRLPSGFSAEEKVVCGSTYKALWSTQMKLSSSGILVPAEEKYHGEKIQSHGVAAGPLIVYISGQSMPIVINPFFLAESTFDFFSTEEGKRSNDLDLRLGLDAIEQCSLFAELYPGGLLYSNLSIHKNDTRAATEPTRSTLKRYGWKCELSESPLNRRPWTRMKYMFIDELQRGPKMEEFVGYNPRSATSWRFSQHNRYFRQGIWREIVRRNEMNPGVHSHSSWQKSPQQSVPETSFMAPFP